MISQIRKLIIWNRQELGEYGNCKGGSDVCSSTTIQSKSAVMFKQGRAVKIKKLKKEGELETSPAFTVITCGENPNPADPTKRKTNLHFAPLLLYSNLQGGKQHQNWILEKETEE